MQRFDASFFEEGVWAASFGECVAQHARTTAAHVNEAAVTIHGAVFLFLTSIELAIAQRFAESCILKFACVLLVIKNCLNDTALRRCKRNSWTPEAQVFNEQLWAMWPKTVKLRYRAFTPI